MGRIRNCASASLSTGVSGCPLDGKRIKGAILLEPGTALEESMTASVLSQLCHADGAERIYPIFGFVNFTANGGEIQISANGYGPSSATGVSARTDTFDLKDADEGLAASLMRAKAKKYDVVFVDDNNNLFFYDEGNGKIFGFPMACVYANDPLWNSGTEKAKMTVSFCYDNFEDAIKHINFMSLDYAPDRELKGLTRVILKEVSSGKFKVIEEVGGYDRTPEFGQALQTGSSSCFVGASTATYENGMLTIQAEGELALAAPSALYAADVKGIEWVRTEKISA